MFKHNLYVYYMFNGLSYTIFFPRMRALCTKFNDCPAEASRPFDKDRDGFVMSEGAGILILEEMSHAINRGASIYAEVLGYGLSGDAHHMNAPRADEQGTYMWMMEANYDGGVNFQDIGYINAPRYFHSVR